MNTRARVVVIGGGISGCSLLYHLTKLGWTDVMLVDKNELTSGSTWLAAGNVVQWTANRCNARLHRYSIELYQRLEAETGQETGWRTTGSLRLATTPKDSGQNNSPIFEQFSGLLLACSETWTWKPPWS